MEKVNGDKSLSGDFGLFSQIKSNVDELLMQTNEWLKSSLSFEGNWCQQLDSLINEAKEVEAKMKQRKEELATQLRVLTSALQS